MEELVKKFFKIYCKFFKADVYVSLLYGREYKTIYAFMKVYNDSVLDTNISGADSHEKLDELSDIVDEYIDNIKTNFSFFDEKEDYFDCECNFDNLGFERLYAFMSNTTDIYEAFAKSYNQLSKYEDATMLHGLLIEYNNFLSHVIKYFCNENDSSNLDRATAHLYRGAIDGYKEIIDDEKLLILPNGVLFSEFIEIRNDEVNLIGKKTSNDKIIIIDKYSTLCDGILSRY